MRRIIKNHLRPTDERYKTGANEGKSKAAVKVAEMKNEFSMYTDDYLSGTKKFNFDDKLYKGPSGEISTLLQQIQHRKCCYCEGRDEGDTEHFRPKGMALQKENEPAKYPGYFWLAYDWDNLFFSCKICNQNYKKNFFPLKDPAKYAPYNGLNIADEEPLVVHPEQDIPENEIGFEKEFARRKTHKGYFSVRYYGLNRDTLLENRKEIYDDLFLVFAEFLVAEKAGYASSEIEKLKKRFLKMYEEKSDDRSRYSAMVKANFEAFYRKYK